MIIHNFLVNNFQSLKQSASKVFIVSGNKISNIFNRIFHKEKPPSSEGSSSEGYCINRSQLSPAGRSHSSLTISRQTMNNSPVVKKQPTNDIPIANICWDDATVQQLILDNPASIETRDLKGQTPLLYAVDKGSLELAQKLLDLGANIEAKQTDKDYTPLHLAVFEENLNMVQLLLDRNADATAQSTTKKTPLHLAASIGNLEITKQLLNKHGDVDPLDENNFTPLHCAVQANCLKVVEYLLEKKSNIDAQDRQGNTPLFLAAKKGQLEIAEFLLQKKAFVDECNFQGYTPFHAAVLCGNRQLIELFLHKGANIEAKTTTSRLTPLHLATVAQNIDIVTFLLEKGANVNVLNSNGCTPAMSAQILLSTEIQQLLEEKSGNFDKIWVTQKLLAARFGIALKLLVGDEVIDLQNLNPIITYPKLLQSFEQFFLSKQENEIWKLNDFKEVVNTLQQGYKLRKNQDVELAMDRLKQNKTIAISTGWIGHSTGVVIEGDLLFKCNRGERSKHLPAGILVYKINKRENLKEVLEQLVAKKSKDQVENEMDQKLELEYIDTINCHDQSVGNCAWASAKLVLRATLYAQLLKKGVQPDIAKAETRKLYKEWSAQDRLLALQEYSQLVKGVSSPGKQDLFMKILQKYKNRKTVSNQAFIQELCEKGIANSE